MDQGMRYAAYTQISPERDVQGAAFSKGQINFRLNLDSMSRWNPYRSYIRMRLRMTREDGTALGYRSRTAPCMFQGDSFWQQINLSCNGVKVSSVDDYYLQVAAWKKRMMYDQSRRDNMLADTNFAQASYEDRLAQVQRYGFTSEPNWEPFSQLHQEDGVFVRTDDEVKIQAPGNVIEYRSAGDGGVGTIDLLESELEVGDIIKITINGNDDDAYTLRRIVAITTNTITVDLNLNALAATDIIKANSLGTVIQYSKAPEARQVTEYELIYKPCLGFFEIDDFLPGNYQLELTPFSENLFKEYAVENHLFDDPADFDFDLQVLDLQFYAYTGIAKSPMNGSKHYEFAETRCQGQTIVNQTLSNKCFVVNKGAHMYTMAFQQGNAGNYGPIPRANFKVEGDFEKSIIRYQLRCGGHTLPTPLPDIRKDEANNIDLSTQQYYEELMYTRSAYLADPESLTEWYERGPYYTYRMPKPAENPSNRLYVSVEFSQLVPAIKPTLLIMDTYYTGFTMQLDNGIVKSITRDPMIN